MLQVKRYSDHLRPQSKKLNKHHFVDLRAQQENVRQDLINLQHTLIQDPCKEELIQQEMQIKQKYIDIVSSSISLIQQQSQIEWIKHGDDNTRLFHAKAKQRKLATYIYSIRDAIQLLVKGFDQVRHIMLEFYKVLLGKQQRTRKEINLQVIQQGPTLCLEDQVGQCKHFSDKEIKDSFYSILTFKSPNPDGYNSGFFKAWGTIGPMICSTVQEFFHTGVMPKYISVTKLIVLPKVPHPQIVAISGQSLITIPSINA